MKEALTIIMLVLLTGPLLIGVRRVRRALDRAAEKEKPTRSRPS